MTEDLTHVTPEALKSYLVDVLTARSFFAFDAKVVADTVIHAIAIDRSTYGIGLLRRILDDTERGEIDPRGRPLLLDDSPSVAYIDGSSAAGPVGISECLKVLLPKVAESGAGIAVVKGGRELGHPAISAARFAAEGLVAICATTHLTGDSPESVVSRVAAAFPIEDGAPACFESPDASLWAVFLSAIANGNSPARKAASSNRSVAEHVVIALDPAKTTTFSKMAERLSAFTDTSRLPDPTGDTLSIDSEEVDFLTACGTDQNIEPPWSSGSH